VKQYVNLRLFRDYKKVRYYTFHIEEQEESETLKFFNKLKTQSDYANELNELANWLFEIGNKYGALPFLFRFEDEAVALPPNFQGQRRVFIEKIEKNNLRLYCIWISEEIVILANGGVKLSAVVQDSIELMPHLRFAKAMGKQINRLIVEGNFRFMGKEIFEIDNIDLTI
jgi:disulfide oxidoreductase YuzD